MEKFLRFGFMSLVGFTLISLGSGCVSSKKHRRETNALQAQVNVLTDELVRLDQGVQDARSSAQGTSSNQAMWEGSNSSVKAVSAPSGSAVAMGSVYRTPSGFELPATSIQQALKNAGYYNGTVDGKIGSDTKNAVKAFQRDNGLTADGVVGRGTWEKLKAYLNRVIK